PRALPQRFWYLTARLVTTPPPVLVYPPACSPSVPLPSDCSSGYDPPTCLRPLLCSLPVGTSTRAAGSSDHGASSSSSSAEIICDAAHIITNVKAKWPGSVHDSRIYREFDGFLLGDRGYPCQPTLLTPYPDPGPQQKFNQAHCRTRARVEMTIGLLKACFQCLRHLKVTPERACDIIVACVVLHNIATIRGEQHPALQMEDPDDNPIHPADIQDGRAVRDIICQNHFTV
ncbi:putative nuclease HARBI1, partial [Epinephelus fuscoguttatus]|uniref:putative nuclease HARBI1 n=1 Tax=Epinephelus fuscoguttatus TaxID=293821 RepID=UPI0020D18BFA